MGRLEPFREFENVLVNVQDAEERAQHGQYVHGEMSQPLPRVVKFE